MPELAEMLIYICSPWSGNRTETNNMQKQIIWISIDVDKNRIHLT